MEETGRVLVIDDEKLNRLLLSRHLQGMNYVVTVAEGGKQGLTLLKEGQFDVVLLDLMMPVIDGYQVLKKIKADKALQHIPVIIISALDDIPSITTSIQLGAVDYLPKPFDPALLKTRLEAALASKRLHDMEQSLRLAKGVQWVGRTVGSYKIEAEIGQGTTAVVYRAYQSQLERWVAIKVLKLQPDMNEAFLERFHQEAKSVAQLRHPNILTVYDYGEESGSPYIAMEYVSEGTLEEQMNATPLPWQQVADYVLPVARALAYAHGQGLVHCDVKPANILLARSDWTLLADFGLANLRSGGKDLEDEYAISGTPTYISPEQIMGQEPDQRADIYALAIVIYQMLTTKIPFSGDTPVEIMMNRLHHLPMLPSEYNPNISPKLEMALIQALSRDREKRYETMEQFIADLEAVPMPMAVDGQANKSTEKFTTTLLRFDKEPEEFRGVHFLDTSLGKPIRIPDKEDILIGRADPDNRQPPDVDLSSYEGDGVGVSRHQARLYHSPEGWLLQDLYSTNGTYVNNTRLTPRVQVRIRHGDSIRFGKLHLAFFDNH